MYRALRDLIVRGQLPPGSRLSEADTAVRFGVSRTPAREALMRLHADGFLWPIGSSTRTQLAVTHLTEDDMVQVYELTAVLEGAAAREVSRLAKRSRARLASELRGSIKQLGRAMSSSPTDLDALFRTHAAFHDCLVNTLARPRIRSALDVLRPQTDRYEYAYATLVGPRHDATLAEHRAITEAIADGSGPDAEAAVRANYFNSAARMRGVIRQAGSRGGVLNAGLRLTETGR